MKYRKIILLVLVLVITQYLQSQQRWSNNYLSGHDPITRGIIECYDKGYLLLGWYGPNYPSYNWLIKTDINGNVLWNKTFGIEDVTLAFLDIAISNQNCYYLAGSTHYYSEEDPDPIIMKLDSCGEKEWCKVFIEDGNNYSIAITTNNDGGITVLLSHMSNLPFLNRICLAKLDNAGNLLWKQCYNSTDTSVHNQEGHDLTLTPEGGFLITGMCYYADPNNPSIGWMKPYYIKADSLGNFEWETVAHNEISDKGGQAWNSVLSPDGKYYYSSISHYYHPPYGDAPAILKLGLDGEVNDIYDIFPINVYGKMIEGNFINDSTLMASAVWGSSGPPKAITFDTLGNVINQSDLLDNEWMSYTEVTHDNKLLYFTNIHDDNDNFDVFLFKLNNQLECDTLYTAQFNYDSLCPYQIESDTIVQDGCGLIVGNEEIYQSNVTTNSLLVYPNPATKNFTVEVNEKFTPTESSIYIYDINGILIKTLIVPKGQNKSLISVDNWKKGLYLIRLSDKNGNIVSGKITVQ